MRKALWTVLLCLLLTACASMTPAAPEDQELQAVIEVPGQSKDQLFARTLAWMAESFVSSKAVIELQDKENGRIIGHGRTSFSSMGLVEIPCDYTLIVDVKDEKLRLTFNNFIGQWGKYRNEPYLVAEAGHARQIKQNLSSLPASLEAYLKKPESKW